MAATEVVEQISPAPAGDDVLLSVENLHKWFDIRRLGFFHVGNVQAVDGVDFTLRRGESVTVVGESGSGKSTLVRTILGLHPLTKGRIVFEGKPVDGKNPKELRAYRQRVGFVQQNPFGALPPFMHVRRILEEPMLVNGVKDRAERERRIRQVMEDVRLIPVDDYLYKFPHQLSGGQQQRLVIARAIILGPSLLVADEPVSMLDASVRVEILRLLDRLQKQYDISIIYITHDLSTVRFFSDRIFVMYGAKLVEKAPTKDLLANPLHPYTRALMNAIPDPDPGNVDRFREVPGGEPPSLMNPPPGCRFHPRCPQFVEGLCDVEEPPELEQGPGHLVSCWLYSDDRHTEASG